jgi:transcription initiation factor TFIID TATA-box-binding protein
MPEIVNVVAAGTLGRELNIRAVGDGIHAAEVKSQTGDYRTPTTYIRAHNNGPLVTLYESGSYHISGAGSVKEAKQTLDWLICEFELIGVENVDASFNVKNVVVVGDLGKSINLNELSTQLGFEYIEYEPELFSGMIYRPEERDSVFLIFSSGRVVIPGSPSEECGLLAFDWLSGQIEVKYASDTEG